MDSAGGKESKADNPEIKAAAGDRQLPPSDKGSLSGMLAWWLSRQIKQRPAI